MYTRKILSHLQEWIGRKDRKPLILRGARQVGKTTLIRQFSSQFDFFIDLNLELKKDREIFEQSDDVQKIMSLLLLRNNISLGHNQKLLLFIDEIQQSGNAIKLLRYFYEEKKDIFVIAAGSLLENLLDKSKQFSFPVGRVEYLILRPFSFEEYITAAGEEMSAALLDEIPFPSYGHQKLLELFREYCLIGGMPEVVKTYLESRDLVLTGRIFQDLLTTYLEDAEKYAQREKDKPVLRHVIEAALRMGGERIKFEGFGQSNYKSREVAEALHTVEKAMLLNLTYPATSPTLPLLENRRKSPKLHLLDTGMLNHFAGIRDILFTAPEITSVFAGKIAEHITGQELLAAQYTPLAKNMFWVREKNQSDAEVDFIVQENNLLIPVEVKAGKTGRLRSLMEFIDIAPHPYAVRVYSGELKLDYAKTIAGKEFHLLNIPFYLVGRIEKYINWMIEKY